MLAKNLNNFSERDETKRANLSSVPANKQKTLNQARIKRAEITAHSKDQDANQSNHKSDKNPKIGEEGWIQGLGDARRTPFFGALISDARMKTAEPIYMCQVAKSAPTSSRLTAGRPACAPS